VSSLSRTNQSLRKLLVGFYRSGGCCEEILVPVKIASSDREIKNTKNNCFISNTPDRQKDLCPSPTKSQSLLGFARG